jgi:hypothetical protein
MPEIQVNLSSGCFSGSYGLFETLRFSWANIALPQHGIVPAILPPEGEWGERLNITYDAFEPENFLGEWDVSPDDPIFLILIHAPHMQSPKSQGRLATTSCGLLADRLDSLVDYSQPQMLMLTQQFSNGLRNAAQLSTDVFFT